MRQIGTYDPEVVVLEVTDSVKAWAIGHGSRSRLSPMCKRCRRGRAGGTRARRLDNNNNNVPAARRRKTSRERERVYHDQLSSCFRALISYFVMVLF